MGRIKFPYMLSCQSILLFVLFGISKYCIFILKFSLLFGYSNTPTITCKKLSFKIFFINEKKLLVLIVREKRRRLNDPFKIFMRQNISKNVIFFLDSSLALFPSIYCQRRMVEEEFLSENLMLFSQTFFFIPII